MVTDVIPLLLLVTGLLDENEIAYAIGGSIASSQYGELRATNDIDILVDLDVSHVPSLVRSMKEHFDIWEDTVTAAVAAGSSFGALHIEWHVKVDLFPASDELLDRRTLERRRAVRLKAAPDRDIYFTSPEDIVLRKLSWFRDSGGILDRQIRDVAGVLKHQRDELDIPYMREMAAKLELGTALEECFQRAGA